MGYPKNKEGLRGIARATYHSTVPIDEIAHPFVPPWEDQPPQSSWRQHCMRKLNRALREGRELPGPQATTILAGRVLDRRGPLSLA